MALKVDLHDKIERASPDQLKQLYGLITKVWVKWLRKLF